MKQKEECVQSQKRSRVDVRVVEGVVAAASDTDPDAGNKQKQTIRNDKVNIIWMIALVFEV